MLHVRSALFCLIIGVTYDEIREVISLSYLLRHSSILSNVDLPQSPEVAISKALRACATDVLEVRMIVSRPQSNSNWKKKDIEQLGMYEVRRTDMSGGFQHPSFRNYSRGDWEKQTIYVVRPVHVLLNLLLLI